MSSETLMEKPTSGKCRCRTQSWYIVFISFLPWFTLYMIYLYSTSVIFSKMEYSLTVDNDTAVLDSSESFLDRDDETEDSSRDGDVNVVDNVEYENDTDSKTEEKPVEELSEDEEVYRAIKSLLVEDQNEVEPEETETNSGRRKGNHATEQKKGAENVAELKREDFAEDQEKRNDEETAKGKETANHLEKLRGEYVGDRAAKGKGTANVLERQREDNAEYQEKRKEEQAAKQKEAANH